MTEVPAALRQDHPGHALAQLLGGTDSSGNVILFPAAVQALNCFADRLPRLPVQHLGTWYRPDEPLVVVLHGADMLGRRVSTGRGAQPSPIRPDSRWSPPIGVHRRHRGAA